MLIRKRLWTFCPIRIRPARSPGGFRDSASQQVLRSRNRLRQYAARNRTKQRANLLGPTPPLPRPRPAPPPAIPASTSSITMQASHLRELSISRKPESRPLAFNNFLASFLQLWMYCSTLPAKACWTRRAPSWLLARLAGLATVSNFSSLAIRHSAFTVYLADPLFSTTSSLRSAVMNLRSLSPRLAPLSSGF